MRKTIWRPVLLGAVMGLLAGIAVIAELSIVIVDSVENVNAIGFYMALFLLTGALGGPVAAFIAPLGWVALAAWAGPPEVMEVTRVPEVFWSNVFAVGASLTLVALAYRLIFERLPMPIRLLPWAAIVIVNYLFILPASIGLQYLLLGGTTGEFLQATALGYRTYWPQMLFDIFVTSLVFVALPAALTRPLWYRAPGSERAAEHLEPAAEPGS